MKKLLLPLLCLVLLLGVLSPFVSAAEVEIKDYSISFEDKVATYYTSYSLGSGTYSPFDGSVQYFDGGASNVHFSDLNNGLIFATTYTISYDDNSAMVKADLPFTLRLENVFLQSSFYISGGSHHFLGPISSYVKANIYYTDGSSDSVMGSVVRRDSSYYDFSFTFTPSKDVLKISLLYQSYLPLSSMPSGSYSYLSANRYLTNIFREYGEDLDTNSSLLSIDQDTKEESQLDEIINGSVDPTPPDESGAVGNLDDLEGGLRDDAQAGLDEGLAMQQSVLEVLTQYVSAFAVVGMVFGFFADIPFFKFLLYISVSVGLFSVLLNLGFDVGKARSRSSQKKSGKGGGS